METQKSWDSPHARTRAHTYYIHIMPIWWPCL